MPPKRSKRQHSDRPCSSSSDALADCVLPQDIMLCILTRLPVKSIHRFKCVCKPWLERFSTARFMKMHHAQLAQNPENQCAAIYSLTLAYDHAVSLIRINSDEARPALLNDNPYHNALSGMDFVGSIHGLLCISYPPLGELIFLWNPALKLSKCVPIPKLDPGAPELVSLGFGFDPVGDDFKVVRLVSLVWEKNMKEGKKMSPGVEVYSADSDSWKTVNLDFGLTLFSPKNDAVVNGNPYWVAKVDGNDCLLCFDVGEMAFDFMPFSGPDFHVGKMADMLVDWKGSLAAIVSDKNEERVNSLDVWVYDGSQKLWSKNHIFGPVELQVNRFLLCLDNGKFLGESLDGNLFMFNSENLLVKEIVMDGAQKGSYQVHGYTESLAYIKGMEKKKVLTVQEEREIDEIVNNICGSFANFHWR